MKAKQFFKSKGITKLTCYTNNCKSLYLKDLCELMEEFNNEGDLWHFLPEMPKINKEVLVAVKYDNEPVQAFWDGKEWKGSFLVRDNMADGFVRDESYKHIQEWIYAWIELPKVPKIPEPF